MPNHIYQKISFFEVSEIEKAEIKNFLGTNIEEGILLDFNKIIPQPENISDENPMILSNEERSFNIENWGTKWNSYENNLLIDSDDYEFEFQTAWSIPQPIIEKIFKRFPKIRMKYLAICEGGWFVYFYNQFENNEGNWELIKNEWRDKNDPTNQIRLAMKYAFRG